MESKNRFQNAVRWYTAAEVIVQLAILFQHVAVGVYDRIANVHNFLRRPFKTFKPFKSIQKTLKDSEYEYFFV